MTGRVWRTRTAYITVAGRQSGKMGGKQREMFSLDPPIYRMVLIFPLLVSLLCKHIPGKMALTDIPRGVLSHSLGVPQSVNINNHH